MSAALAIVRSLASEDAAAVFSLLLSEALGVRVHREYGAKELCDEAGLQVGTAAIERLQRASAAFHAGFGLPLLHPRSLSDDEDVGTHAFRMSDALVDLASTGLTSAAPCDVEVVGEGLTHWRAALASMARTAQPMVLGLRSDVSISSLFAPYAAATTSVVVAPCALPLAAAILRAELHHGAGTVVVADHAVLAASDAPHVDGDDFAEPNAGPLVLTREASAAMPAFVLSRAVYVLRLPRRGELPACLHGVVGGVMAPIGFDPAWCGRVVAERLPGLGAQAAQAMIACIRDPRKIEATATTARFMSDACGLDLDEAVLTVTRSYGVGAPVVRAGLARGFDPRLFVGDVDAGTLLERVARRSGPAARILLHGPSGGGKTAFGAALAGRIAGSGGTAFDACPESLCSRGWGDTERRVSAMFELAALAPTASVIFADEFDGLGGFRDPLQSGGNHALVRCLTNSFLRCLDAHPGVSFVAATNDFRAIDPPLLRRFPLVIRVDSVLTPDREALAWRVILGMAPPRAWRPAGASVSDFVVARERCALLGLRDAGSHAQAVAAARATRLVGVLRAAKQVLH